MDRQETTLRTEKSLTSKSAKQNSLVSGPEA
jgi:hypothetical protein